MNIFFKIIIGLLGAYLLALLVLYVFQRNFIYQPTKINHDLVQKSGYEKLERLTYNLDQGHVGYYHPPAQDNKILFVYFHGNAHHVGSRLDDIEVVLKDGHGFYIHSYPGYGENDGSMSEQNFYESAHQALDLLTSKKGHDWSHIVLAGESLGTGIATEMANHYPAKALILKSPFTSLGAVAQHHYPFFPVKWLIWDRYNSLKKIKNGLKTGALFMTHGRLDSLVPFAQAKKIFEAANQPKQFRKLEQKAHNDLYWSDFYPAFRDFLSDMEE